MILGILLVKCYDDVLGTSGIFHISFCTNKCPKEEKESIPKQGEISIAESPTMPSKDFTIDPEPQIPQTLKEEETHPPNHSFDFDAKLSDDLASFGNVHKRPSNKHCSNPLEKRSLQKPTKPTPFYASSSQVAHWEKPRILDELPKEMPFAPIEEELRCIKEKSILFFSMPTSNPLNPSLKSSLILIIPMVLLLLSFMMIHSLTLDIH
jgi:hypothetical protein